MSLILAAIFFPVTTVQAVLPVSTVSLFTAGFST